MKYTHRSNFKSYISREPNKKKFNKTTNFIRFKNYTYTDLILFLYRPEYYKMEEWDDEENTSAKGDAEIIIAKNNYGKLANIRIKWNVFKDSI
jgi:hypothetical protein